MDYRELFHGCVRVDEQNGVFTPYRFTREQCEQMGHHPEAIQMRIRSTSGVRIAFETVAKVISFDFACDNFAREYVVFDIWENGKYAESACFPPHTTSGTISYICHSTPCQLTVHLPHLARTKLHRLELGELRPIAHQEKRILFYGDSLTQGMTAQRPSFSWASIVSNALDAEMVNFGIGGKKFHIDVLEQAGALQPNAVVVAYGINDSIHEQSTPCMQENIPAFFRQLRLRYPSVPIYAVTAPFIQALCNEGAVQKQLERVRTLTERYAQEQNCVVIDGKALLPDNPILIAEDAHPNELGMQRIAQTFLRCMFNQG